MNSIRKIVRQTLNELDGLAFKNQEKYSKQAKDFFEDRYSKVISLIPQVKSNAVGLEIGLCSGVLAFSIKRCLNLERLYSLEHPGTVKLYKPKFLNKVKEENIVCTSVDLRKGKLPWKSNFLDFIIFSEVMEHLVPSDIPYILREFKRVLKKDGFLLITTPNIASLVKRLNLLKGKNPVEFDLTIHDGGTFGHIREYSIEELINILNNQNFSILKKGYFEIDINRNIFTKIENYISKAFPFFSNNLKIVAKK